MTLGHFEVSGSSSVNMGQIIPPPREVMRLKQNQQVNAQVLSLLSFMRVPPSLPALQLLPPPRSPLLHPQLSVCSLPSP